MLNKILREFVKKLISYKSPWFIGGKKLHALLPTDTPPTIKKYLKKMITGKAKLIL